MVNRDNRCITWVYDGDGNESMRSLHELLVVWYGYGMRNIAQFTITKTGSSYTAEGVDLPVVTQADDLDTLILNIRAAVSHLEGEDPSTATFTKDPNILVNYELLQYA